MRHWLGPSREVSGTVVEVETVLLAIVTKDEIQVAVSIHIAQFPAGTKSACGHR